MLTSNQSQTDNLCIPKVESSVNESYIRNKIEQSRIGYLKRYKEIPWKDNTAQKRILVRIQWNIYHPYFSVFKEQLQNGNGIKIVHDYPHIWNVYLAKN